MVPESLGHHEHDNDEKGGQQRHLPVWAIFFSILTFLLGAGSYIAVYFGGIDVLNGDMSLGELVQFVTYCGYLFGPLSWMTHLPRAPADVSILLRLLLKAGCLPLLFSKGLHHPHAGDDVLQAYDVLDEEPVIKDKEDSKEFLIEGAFDFQRVSFGYHTYEPVLENISFQVKPRSPPERL